MTADAPAHKQRHRGRLASLVRGRVRVKVHPESRTPHSMQEIQNRLASQEGVHDVIVNPATGSVTVNYDHERYSTAGILGLLEDLDIVVESTVHAEHGPSPGFLAAIDDLNARIHAATGVPIDLKLAVPLAFVGAGIWSIGKKGLMIESVPGWLFLWFAFDMFVKMHPAHPSREL
jgi:cation transport ATPase